MVSFLSQKHSPGHRIWQGSLTACQQSLAHSDGHIQKHLIPGNQGIIHQTRSPAPLFKTMAFEMGSIDITDSYVNIIQITVPQATCTTKLIP